MLKCYSKDTAIGPGQRPIMGQNGGPDSLRRDDRNRQAILERVLEQVDSALERAGRGQLGAADSLRRAFQNLALLAHCADREIRPQAASVLLEKSLELERIAFDSEDGKLKAVSRDVALLRKGAMETPRPIGPTFPA